MENLLSDGFWSISGALIGAFTGALFGFLITIYIEYRRVKKLKKAFYEEAEYILRYIISFLISVSEEYKKKKIDVGGGDTYSAPMKIDFNLFSTLHLELYKTNYIPSQDHRNLVHNISLRWGNIFQFEEGRIEYIQNTNNLYKVDIYKSTETAKILIDLIYNLDLFISQKEKFNFSKNRDVKSMATIVFKKNNIENSDLLNKLIS